VSVSLLVSEASPEVAHPDEFKSRQNRDSPQQFRCSVRTEPGGPVLDSRPSTPLGGREFWRSDVRRLLLCGY
jgi:hypothetical protein